MLTPAAKAAAREVMRRERREENRHRREEERAYRRAERVRCEEAGKKYRQVLDHLAEVARLMGEIPESLGLDCLCGGMHVKEKLAALKKECKEYMRFRASVPKRYRLPPEVPERRVGEIVRYPKLGYCRVESINPDGTLCLELLGDKKETN